MSRELDNYVKVEELEVSGMAERVFYDRPVIGALITVLLGVALFLIPSIVTKILGVITALGGLYALVIYRAQKVLAFYEKGLVAYKSMDDKLGIYLPYRQISGWSYKRTNLAVQNVIFTTKNNDYLYIETPDLKPMKKLLVKYLPDREMTAEGGKR